MTPSTRLRLFRNDQVLTSDVVVISNCRVAHLLLGNGDSGGSREDHQHAGLFRLLHKSPLSKLQKPVERARCLKAVYATLSGLSDTQSQPSTSALIAPASEQSWPKDTKDRSETAFGGWDP